MRIKQRGASVFMDVLVILTKPPGHHKPFFVVAECDAVAISRPSRRDVTFPGWQNVHMKMSNCSWSYFKFQKKKRKTPQWKDCRAWQQRTGLYITSVQGRYFGQEGVKTLCNPCHQKLPVFSDIGKSFPSDIIIGRAVIKS